MKGVSQTVIAAVALLAVLVVLINPETLGLDVARDGKLVRALVLLWILAAMVTVMVAALLAEAQRAVLGYLEVPAVVPDRLSLICTRLC